ncbi:uncharacterized protein LOC111107144 isoform X3 [Crassostrea virginica]
MVITDMADVPGHSSAPYFSPRKSTENFSRLCQLIMTICSDLFRTILSHHIKPENLRMELDSKINKKRLLKRGILSVTQRNLLYPEPSQSTYIVSAHMDLSLLYTLLRNICPTIPQHQKGWGKTPNGNDNSLSACIERIRIQRNEISGHSTRGEIDDITFKDIWWKLRSDIVIIEKMITGGNMFERGIDELLICELNPSRAQKYVETFRNVQSELIAKQEKINDLQNSTCCHGHQIAVKKEKIDDLENSFCTLAHRVDNLEDQNATVLNSFKELIKEMKKELNKDLKARFDEVKKEQKDGFSELNEELKDSFSRLEKEQKDSNSEMKKELKKELKKDQKGTTTSMFSCPFTFFTI